MGIVVKKFGGTSVGDLEKMRRAAERAVRDYKAGRQVVVVVSAMGHTTDELLELAAGIGDDLDDREVDLLMAAGEQISSALMALTMRSLGVEAVALTGPQAGIMTDSAHRKARILEVTPDRIRRYLGEGKVVVVAGFQGMDRHGDVTTLGRGGSDMTAVALAAALKAESCEIYTDVDGVYTADPRVVPDARLLKSVSYEEMMELASLGAQVLQLRSVEYAKNYGVRVEVRSSFNDNPGTFVEGDADLENGRIVSGVTYDVKVAKIAISDVPDVPGIAHKIFSSLARERINVDTIIQGAVRDNLNDIAFTVPQEELGRAQAIARKVSEDIGGGEITVDPEVAKVSIVGAGMVTNPGVAARMFGALAGEGINIQMISTSEIKISCIIGEGDVYKAVLALHREFELSKIE